MIVVLYPQYYKEKNSTANPANDEISDGVEYEVVLKEDTSVLHPTIIFRQQPFDTDFPIKYNYAKIPDFDRYYYIDDWTSSNTRWIASLTVDALGSWRDDILFSTQYVLRAANTYNEDIPDKFYPTTADYVTGITWLPYVWEKQPENGTYVLGAVGSNNSYTNGCVTYYAMSHSTMSKFIAYLNSQTFISARGMDTLEQIPEELVKAIWDPMDYIISCKWFPVKFNNVVGTSTTGIYFGWYSWDDSTVTSGSIKVLHPSNSLLIVGSESSAGTKLAKHPQYTRGSYLNHPPYNNYTYKAPPFSDVAINTAAYPFDGTHDISAMYWIDFVSGLCTMRLSITHPVADGRQTDYILSQETVPLAVDVSLTKIVYQSSEMGLIAAGAGIWSEVFSGLSDTPVVGDAFSTLGKLGNAAMVLGLESHTVGTPGGFAVFSLQPCIQYTKLKIVDENREHNGRPLCENKQLITLKKNSSHSGYVIIGTPDIKIPATPTEVDDIKNKLMSGVYLE